MKVVDQVTRALAINERVENVLAGRRFDRAPFTGLATFYSVGAVAGIEQEINVGGTSITPRIPANHRAGATSLVIPDDLLIADVPVYQGQLIQWSVNAGANAGNFLGRIEIEQGVPE